MIAELALRTTSLYRVDVGVRVNACDLRECACCASLHRFEPSFLFVPYNIGHDGRGGEGREKERERERGISST